MSGVGEGAGSDHGLARELADRAGELLLGLRPSLLERLDAASAGRVADAAAQDLLAQLIAAHRPGDAVLSEEAADTAQRLTADRVWIIDPLDGTREFGEGRDDWAVHVALWQREADGGRLTAGAVALPAQDRTLSTEEPVAPQSPDASAPWRVVVSRSRPPAVLDSPAFVATLGEQRIEPRAHGSAGAKAAEVVLGHADVYLHAASRDGSGLNQWDAAAPAAVAAAAGLHVSHLDGSPVAFNTHSVVTGDFLICRSDIAAPLLAALAAAAAETGR